MKKLRKNTRTRTFMNTGTTTAIVYKGPATLAKLTLRPVFKCLKHLKPIKLLNLKVSSMESQSILD